MKVRSQQIRRRNDMLRELCEMVTAVLIRNGVDEAKAKEEAEELSFQLHRRWRGITFTFPIKDDLAQKRLKLHIINEYDGSNADSLARQFSITESFIYEVMREHQKRLRPKNQGCLELDTPTD